MIPPTICPVCRGTLKVIDTDLDSLKRLECTCGLVVLYNTENARWWRVRNSKQSIQKGGAK